MDGIPRASAISEESKTFCRAHQNKRKTDSNICQHPKCSKECTAIYYGVPLCPKHLDAVRRERFGSDWNT